EPKYEIGRLNQKLLRLIGNPLLDSMTCEYDRLYSVLIKIMHEHGVPGLIASILTPESVEALPFILHTLGMKRRLTDIATLTNKTFPDEDSYVSVNGANFPIKGLDFKLVPWAKKTLEAIEYLPQQDPDISPERLPENPLYVWGAAVMDGFFTDEQIPLAVKFINEQFGSLPKHPQVSTFLAQADALAHLLVNFLENSEVSRFVKLCAQSGFIFQVRDRTGNVVIDGFKMIR
ncbi:MAG: hypothetical protein M3362_25590, partial [Acidobacteriota bacterium]|nr:hypothetical protein [Acidobacteriota bacterium]